MANKGVVCALSFLALCGVLASSGNVALGATVTTNTVVRLSDRSTVAGASTTLVRDVDGVTAAAIISDLEAGAAHTMWLLIFNDPSRCSNRPCAPAKGDPPDSAVLAAGGVASSKGKASFAGQVAAGADSGLTNPLGAEIHVVIRSHGPAIAEMLEAQTTTLNGGCPPNKCANVQGSPHQPFTDDTTVRLDAMKKLLDRVARQIGVPLL